MTTLAEKRLNAAELEQFNVTHNDEVFKYNNGKYLHNTTQYFRTGIAAYVHNKYREWVPHEVCYGNWIYREWADEYKYISCKVFTLEEFTHNWERYFLSLDEAKELHATYLKMFDMLLDESCFKGLKDNIQFHTLNGERVAYTYFFDDKVYYNPNTLNEGHIHPELREIAVFAMATRNMLEYPRILRCITRLLKLGVPPILAFFFGNQFDDYNSQSFVKTGGWSQHAFNRRADIRILLGTKVSIYKSGMTSFWYPDKESEWTVPSTANLVRKFGQFDSIYWTEENLLNLIKNTTTENGLVKWW